MSVSACYDWIGIVNACINIIVFFGSMVIVYAVADDAGFNRALNAVKKRGKKIE